MKELGGGHQTIAPRVEEELTRGIVPVTACVPGEPYEHTKQKGLTFFSFFLR